MKPLPRSTAKDVFFHILSAGTLYTVVVSFITLFLEYINIKFPDALDFYYLGSLDTIRGSMASLFIVWPVFVLVTSLISKDLREAPNKHEGGIRKWLLYLTLFLTSITIIVDLITLVNYFLNGEITTRFILKVLTVLIAAGSVFAYYLWDLRRDPSEKTTISRNVAWGASAAVLGSIILGFFFVGSPAHQRLIRLDDQRTNDLNMIQNEVTNYYINEGELPATITELNQGIYNFTAPNDPVTETPYTYTVKNETTYELCATFAANSVNTTTRNYYYYRDDWNHQTGNACFERTVDPSMIDGKGEIELVAPLETKSVN